MMFAVQDIEELGIGAQKFPLHRLQSVDHSPHGSCLCNMMVHMRVVGLCFEARPSWVLVSLVSLPSWFAGYTQKLLRYFFHIELKQTDRERQDRVGQGGAS